MGRGVWRCMVHAGGKVRAGACGGVWCMLDERYGQGRVAVYGACWRKGTGRGVLRCMVHAGGKVRAGACGGVWCAHEQYRLHMGSTGSACAVQAAHGQYR